MPYLANYEDVLTRAGVTYEIVTWDRFHTGERDGIITYRDKKIGHRRNFYDYYKFCNFLAKKINNSGYEKIVVFGLQLAFFLRSLLKSKFYERFVLDIRDHHPLIAFFDVEEVVRASALTVLSSPGYVEWMPVDENYVINHNTNIENTHALMPTKKFDIRRPVRVACIGALRDYDVNVRLIRSASKSEGISLYYHGNGDINERMKRTIQQGQIRNVVLTGRYTKDEEGEFYEKCDFVNVLRYSDGINNKTALPNRLYNAAIWGRPLLAFKGTHLSRCIENYGLGLALDSFDDLEVKMLSFIDEFDESAYDERRRAFLQSVIDENSRYQALLTEFVR